MAISYVKQSTDSIHFPTKIPTQVFKKQFYTSYGTQKKNLRIANTIISKKSTAGGLTIPKFKLCYRGIETRTT